MRKVYYQCTLHLQSPLALSGGQAEYTDKDVLLGGDGRPFIPASSLAGALRSLATAKHEMLNDKPLAEALFGYISPDGSHAKSRVTVYDGTFAPDAVYRKYQRDGVALNEHKNIINGAKYDFEIIESKAPFTFYLEADEPFATALSALLAEGMATGLRLGGKTTRGYGQMMLSVKTRSFDLAQTGAAPDGFADWLDFDLFAPDAFTISKPLKKDSRITVFLQAEFTLQGALAVREYVSSKGAGVADFMPLYNLAGKPVIPGTSWAGVFRHRMQRLALEAGVADAYDADALFGCAGEGENAKRAQIIFSESEIIGSTERTRTHTAIDRVTGAAAESKLFTGSACYGGSTCLTIALPSGQISPIAQQLLAATILDLHHGLAAVGGGTSTGQGMLQLTSLIAHGQDVLAQLEQNDLTIFEQGAC